MKRILIPILAVGLLLPGSVIAQELTGRITGLVTDEQGAVIPGASITATHLATNTTYDATTGPAGRFVIPNIRLGSYNVEVEFTGFSRAIVQGVLVEVGGTADINVTLQVGAVTEEVTVTADVSQEIVNTVNAELGAVVDTRRVLELPLNGRNASHLILMQAGVFFARDPDGQGDKLIIHGQRHRSLNITLDGIDTQDNYNRASSIMLDHPLIQLTAENVAEFRVVTGLGTAETGRGGAHMIAVTKSGTNDFHGGVFWFHRNTVFNAHTFFQNATGVPKSPLIRNQFGGGIGGPFVEDRTFFYFGLEGIKESKGIPVNRTVYTAQARQGIFRYLDNLRISPAAVAANPDLIREVNLLECGANVLAVLGRDCVDDRFNSANPASVDPLIAQIMDPSLVPLPNNFDTGDGLNTGGLRFNAKSKTDQWTPSFRLDHRFNDVHSFAGTFNYLKRTIDGDFINDREPAFPAIGSRGIRFTLSRMASGTLTSAFSPNLVNEFRTGYLRGENSFLAPTYPEGLNLPYSLDFWNITSPLTPDGWGPNGRTMNNWHVRNTTTWIRGNHQLKFGADWRHKDVDIYSFFQVEPEYDFDFEMNEPDWSESDLRALSTGGTVTDIETVDRERGEQMMNQLVAAWGEMERTFNAATVDGPYLSEQSFDNRYYNRELDLFFNDTWQIHPRFTLNLGLRWEYATVPTERDGFALVPEGGFDGIFGVSGPAGLFNPGTMAGRPCTVPTIADPDSDDITNLILDCATRNVPAGKKAGLPFWEDDYNNFAPVVSFAWDPWGDGKTAVRVGFRISYFQDAFAVMRGNLDDNEGVRIAVDCTPADGDCATNPLFLRDGFPTLNVPAFDLSVPLTLQESPAIDVRTYHPKLKTPYYEEWTLGVSREFARNWAVEVRYVGNRGLQLRRVMDFNEPNIFAFDPNTGMSFLDAFLIAQANYACNRLLGTSNFRHLGNESDLACQALPTASLMGPNALMDVLLLQANSESSGGYRDSSLRSRLERNEVGAFIHRLTHEERGEGMRGGAFFAAALRGDLPLDFFQVNPFIGSARAMLNNSFSNYHAVEVEVRRRFAEGFTLQANYNFSKALADFDGDSNTLLNEDRTTLRDTRYEYGEIAPRHGFNANWIYEFPVGPGKALEPENVVARKLFTGWQFGGIVIWRSGRPLTIISGVGSFIRRALSDNNSVNLSVPLSKEEIRKLTGKLVLPTGPDTSGVFWFDPCLSGPLGKICSDPNAIQGLFIDPQPGQAGTLPRKIIFGPRAFSVDVNLSKRTQLTERTSLEFRWEMFNLFNKTNFANPDVNDIRDANFGLIDRTVINPRLMQFALKLHF